MKWPQRHPPWPWPLPPWWATSYQNYPLQPFGVWNTISPLIIACHFHTSTHQPWTFWAKNSSTTRPGSMAISEPTQSTRKAPNSTAIRSVIRCSDAPLPTWIMTTSACVWLRPGRWVQMRLPRPFWQPFPIILWCIWQWD